MELIYWYVFWILILVIAIVLVSFPGWGPCEQWFQIQLWRCGNDTWLYLWALALVGLAAAGWAGDPQRSANAVTSGTESPWYQFWYRTWYGFLVVMIFLWWLSLFGGRNLGVATLVGLFNLILAIVMGFLSRNRIAQLLYFALAIWLGAVFGYTLWLSRLNWNNPAVTHRLF